MELDYKALTRFFGVAFFISLIINCLWIGKAFTICADSKQLHEAEIDTLQIEHGAELLYYRAEIQLCDSVNNLNVRWLEDLGIEDYADMIRIKTCSKHCKN